MDHQKLLRFVDLHEEAMKSEADKGFRARRFYDGDQLSDETKRILRDRGQPEIVINAVADKVRAIEGYEANTRGDPTVIPSTLADINAAEACQDVLRYAERRAMFDETTSLMFKNVLIEGTGAIHIYTMDDGFGGRDIFTEVIPWDLFIRDPNSRKHDFSDASYLGYAQWLDIEEATDLYGEKANIQDGTFSVSQLLEDRPALTWWSGDKQRVRIVTIWRRERGRWRFYIFNKTAVLQEGDSPYHTGSGETICPIVAMSFEIDSDNVRYGVIEQFIGPQTVINAAMSRGMFSMVARQAVISQGAVRDVNDMKRQLAKPDGVVIKENPMGEVSILPNEQVTAIHMSLVKMGVDIMGNLSPNEEMLGVGSDYASGKAVVAKQTGGQAPLGGVFARLRHFRIKCYKIFWGIVQEYWTEPKWVSVSDDYTGSRYVAINGPLPPAGTAMPDGTATIYPARIDIDIDIRTGPESPGSAAEQFQSLAVLAQAGVQIPPAALIRASTLRDKEQLAQAIEQSQAPPPAAMQKITLEMEKLAAEIEKIRSESAKNTAQAVDMLSKERAV